MPVSLPTLPYTGHMALGSISLVILSQLSSEISILSQLILDLYQWLYITIIWRDCKNPDQLNSNVKSDHLYNFKTSLVDLVCSQFAKLAPPM